MKVKKFYYGGKSKEINLPIPDSINTWFKDDLPDPVLHDGGYNYATIVDIEVFGEGKQALKAIKAFKKKYPEFDVFVLDKYCFLYINNAIILDDNIRCIDEGFTFPKINILVYNKDFRNFKVIKPEFFIGGGEVIAKTYSFDGEIAGHPIATFTRTATKFTNFETWDGYNYVTVNPENIDMYKTEIIGLIKGEGYINNINKIANDIYAKIENSTYTQDDLIQLECITRGKCF